MSYSICVIDDKIPASIVSEFDDASQLNTSNLKYLVRHANWGTEQPLKTLIRKLIGERNGDGTKRWEVSAYTHPNLYIDSFKESLYRADVIVFDWEYTIPINHETVLLEILSSTYCAVFVFSAYDKKVEVESLFAKSTFIPHKERLGYLNKGDTAQGNSQQLIKKIRVLRASNFSFKFTRELRIKSLQTIDGILLELGRATLNNISNYLSIPANSKKDLIDLIAERFRSGLSKLDFSSVPDTIRSSTPATTLLAADKEVFKRIWSYRLYFPSDPKDKIVKRGDIVVSRNSYYLVISADCHLVRFWHKNMGRINMVPLNKIENTNTALKEMLLLCTPRTKLKGDEVSSLIGRIGGLAEGPFILPFVSTGAAVENFLALPKEITSIKIPLPAKHRSLSERKRSEVALEYSAWRGYNKVCTISEPFLTPVIEHVLKTIGGYGVPDYSEHMKEIFKEIVDNFKL